MIVKTKNRWTYNGLFVIFLAALFIRNVFSANIPDFLLIGLLILMVLIGDKTEIISVCILCIPLIMVIKCSYVILSAILMLTIKYGKQIKINLSIIPIILLIIWELLHCFETQFSPSAVIGIFIPIILCFSLSGMKLEDVDYCIILRSLAVCTCVMCVLLLGHVLVKSNFDWRVSFLNMQRLGMITADSETTSFSINPNTLGIVCILTSSGLSQLIIAKANKKSDLLMIVIMLICGVLTQSRTFVILLLISLVLFFIAYKGKIGKKIKICIAIVLCSLIVIVTLNVLFPGAINNIIERFLVEDISSGRNDLLKKYNNLIISSYRIMIFGLGAIDFPKKVTVQYHIAKNVPHNGIQEMIIAWGLIGSILFLWFLAIMFNDAMKKNKNIQLINYIPMILIVAKIFVGQLLTSDYTMLAISFVYLSLCQNFSYMESNRYNSKKTYNC